MKRCADVVPLLSPLLDSALPDDDRDWVEEHLRECDRCRDRLALLAAQGAALREVLGARAQVVDFTGFSDRVLDRIREEKRLRPFERARAWGSEMWAAHRGAFAAASGLAVAAGLALAVVFVPPSTQPDDGVLLADNSPQVEEVDFGTHDGAVLQLSRQTTVIWMSDDKVQQ